jgi:uncharacterized protein
METLADVPAPMLAYLGRNHVLSLATLFKGRPWSASCFYVFDAASVSLILLSSLSTRHGEAMQSEPAVAGSISDQQRSIAKIEGIQFSGFARLLEGVEEERARALYYEAHPVARIMRSSIWRIELSELKYTNNSVVFGRKLHWSRERECVQKTTSSN